MNMFFNRNNNEWSPRRRDRLERFIDEHNHKLELVRTVGSIIAAVTGLLVFLKVFNII